MKEEVIVETFSQIQRSSREPQDVNFSGGVHQRAPPASRERQHACELGRQFSGGAAASWSRRSSSGGGRLGKPPEIRERKRLVEDQIITVKLLNSSG
jgi:hypothetical protein